MYSPLVHSLPVQREILAHRLEAVYIAVVDPVQPDECVLLNVGVHLVVLLSLELLRHGGVQRPPRRINSLGTRERRRHLSASQACRSHNLDEDHVRVGYPARLQRREELLRDARVGNFAPLTDLRIGLEIELPRAP